MRAIDDVRLLGVSGGHFVVRRRALERGLVVREGRPEARRLGEEAPLAASLRVATEPERPLGVARRAPVERLLPMAVAERFDRAVEHTHLFAAERVDLAEVLGRHLAELVAEPRLRVVRDALVGVAVPVA